MDDLAFPTGAKTGRTHAKQITSQKKGRDMRINLKAVAEACIEEGLDPAVEIAKALKATIPMMRNGMQVFDDNGVAVMVPLLDVDTRMRTLNEFLQYTQPKLKSVEVKMSGSLDLTSEQLDNRLNMLLAKAAK
jgi:LPS O-antigen subunit length determinant protein (WzzB/FepE family)